jgi:hypothetical protein
MNKPIIVLEKERDFTDVMNATFSFITQEFKLLFKVIALYAGLPIIAASIPAAIYTQNTFASLFSIIKGNVVLQQPDYGMMALMYILMLVAFLLISGLVGAYFDEYKTKGHGGFEAGDVWRNFLGKSGLFLLLNLVTFFIVSIGFVLCILPGIYFAIPLSLASTILYVEKTDFKQTYNRCFNLIKDNWWATFGVIIVIAIITNILGGLFSIPSMVIGLVQGITVATSETTTEFSSVPVIVSTVIGSIGSFFIYVISYVGVGFQFFSLKEKKDQTSLFKKVFEITND